MTNWLWGGQNKKGEKGGIQISHLGNWINDELYSEIWNIKIEQIDGDDDKFRLNMLSLRYQLNIQGRCFVGSWEYGFDSQKKFGVEEYILEI